MFFLTSPFMVEKQWRGKEKYEVEGAEKRKITGSGRRIN
jgi:hypothetical protein